MIKCRKALYIKPFIKERGNLVTIPSIMFIYYKIERELFNKCFLPHVLKVPELFHYRYVRENKLKIWVLCVRRPWSPDWDTHVICCTKADFTALQWTLSAWNLSIFLAWIRLLHVSEILERYEAEVKISACTTLKQQIFCMLRRCSAPCVCQKVNLQSEW